jgi:hypothetical protein
MALEFVWIVFIVFIVFLDMDISVFGSLPLTDPRNPP